MSPNAPALEELAKGVDEVETWAVWFETEMAKKNRGYSDEEDSQNESEKGERTAQARESSADASGEGSEILTVIELFRQVYGKFWSLISEKDEENESLRKRVDKQAAPKVTRRAQSRGATQEDREHKKAVHDMIAENTKYRSKYEQEQRHARGLQQDLIGVNLKIRKLKGQIWALEERFVQERRERCRAQALRDQQLGVRSPPTCGPDEVWPGRLRSPERVRREKKALEDRRQKVYDEMTEFRRNVEERVKRYEELTDWKRPVREQA